MGKELEPADIMPVGVRGGMQRWQTMEVTEKMGQMDATQAEQSVLTPDANAVEPVKPISEMPLQKG